MEIKVLPYEDLSRDQLYDILQLRAQIFVVEQDCVYQDLDGKDRDAFHLIARENHRIIGTARIFKPGYNCDEACFGRLSIEESYRERGYAHTMINEIHSFIKKEFGSVGVRIEAQNHLRAFYSKHGYKAEGATYNLDNIEHIQMIRPQF